MSTIQNHLRLPAPLREHIVRTEPKTLADGLPRTELFSGPPGMATITAATFTAPPKASTTTTTSKNNNNHHHHNNNNQNKTPSSLAMTTTTASASEMAMAMKTTKGLERRDDIIVSPSTPSTSPTLATSPTLTINQNASTVSTPCRTRKGKELVCNTNSSQTNGKWNHKLNKQIKDIYNNSRLNSNLRNNIESSSIKYNHNISNNNTNNNNISNYPAMEEISEYLQAEINGNLKGNMPREEFVLEDPKNHEDDLGIHVFDSSYTRLPSDKKDLEKPSQSTEKRQCSLADPQENRTINSNSNHHHHLDNSSHHHHHHHHHHRNHIHYHHHRSSQHYNLYHHHHHHHHLHHNHNYHHHRHHRQTVNEDEERKEGNKENEIQQNHEKQNPEFRSQFSKAFNQFTFSTTKSITNNKNSNNITKSNNSTNTTITATTILTSKFLRTLSIICLILLHLFGSTSADICPKVCFCQAMAKHIGCAKRGLTEIPDLIPSDTRQLSLNENLFSNKILVRKNFSRLPNLVDLFLDGCGIEVITLDTFADLRHLSMLDLSNNKLRHIEDYTFRGLSLKHLFLNSNPGIQFAPKAFTGFRTVGLFLRKCGLHNMSQESIRPLNGTLKMIWLNDNNFEYLPMEWFYLFKTLSHVRLENNPMHCNCELAWLYQMYVTNSSLFPEDVVLTCRSPRRLKSKAFNTLTIEDFQCQLPIFQGVDILVGPHLGKLSCVARADPSPTLFWEGPDGTSQVYEPSEDRAVKTTEGVLFIHNHHTSSNARYRCIANNPAGNVTFTLQVTWPPSGSTTRHFVTTVPMESSLSKTHGRSSNQSAMNMTELTADVLFTLMELIGAVIGTFLLTFLLCIVIFHFFCRQQRPMGQQDRDHPEKRRTPENHYVMADIDESSIKMMDHKDLVS